MSTYSTTILSDLPVAYWRLGELSGTSAGDASSNGRTGTYGGGVIIGMAGAIHGENDASARFGSTGANVAAPLLPLMGQWTAEAWVYPTAAQTGTPYIVCDRFSLSGINFGLVVNFSAGTCAVSTLYFNGSVINTPQVELTLNAWTHVAGTYDGSNLKSYINSVLSQTLASTTAPASVDWLQTSASANRPAILSSVPSTKWPSSTPLYPRLAFLPITTPLSRRAAQPPNRSARN